MPRLDEEPMSSSPFRPIPIGILRQDLHQRIIPLQIHTSDDNDIRVQQFQLFHQLLGEMPCVNNDGGISLESDPGSFFRFSTAIDRSSRMRSSFVITLHKLWRGS